jgi:hypothetical protein
VSGISDLRNFKCVCSCSLRCVYGQTSLRSSLFWAVLICGVFQALLFEYCLSIVVVFNFHTPFFLLPHVEFICSQVHTLTSWVFPWYKVNKNSSIYGGLQVSCVFPQDGFRKVVFVKNIRRRTKSKDEDCVSDSVIGHIHTYIHTYVRT